MTIFVSLSGGMDSTAALSRAVSMSADVVAVSVDYRQRHAVELRAARAIAEHLKVRHVVLDARDMLHGSALLGGGPSVPHGHYAEDSMKQTVVQGRNLLFASRLVGLTKPGDTVMLGVHAGDHFVYPDCRPSFWEPFAEAVRNAYDVTVATPWLRITKAEIIGEEPMAPYSLSWSCYEGGDVHCGRCGTCVERAEAFHLAGVADPTEYADRAFWKEAVASAST